MYIHKALTYKTTQHVLVIIDIMFSNQQYLSHTKVLSIQHHSLCHIDQSRDYKMYPLHNVPNIVDYN